MFPVIRHINDILPYIQDASEILVADKGDYIVINYQVVMQDTFPEGNDIKALMRRECRGLLFDKETGQIIRRPYHKFFNVNERSDSHQSKINFANKHCVLDKLDGSMLSPFICKGNIHWGTRMGVTDVADQTQQFLALHPEYNTMCVLLIQNGHTPMFEWCSRKQRIVLDYGHEDQLVLTGIRNMITGEYWDKFQEDNLASMYGIPTVRSFESKNNIQELIEHTRGLENTEGFVIRFENGDMFKIKCDWYCQLHKTLEHIVHEKDVIRLILDEKLDDVKAILPEDRIKSLDKFSNILYAGISALTNKVVWSTIELYDNHNGSRKDFALAVKDMKEKNFMFKALDILEKCSNRDNTAHISFITNELFNFIVKYVRDGSNSQTKVNEMRWIWGNHKWEDFG